MSFLAGLKTAVQSAPNNTIEIKDTLGGGFTVIDTGLYPVTITAAYLTQKDKSVRAHFEFKLEDNRKFNASYTVLNDQGQHIYTNDKGEAKYLSGFVPANAISYLALKGKNIFELATTKKTISQRNFKTNTDEPVEAEELTDLIGKEVTLGLIREAKFKRSEVSPGVWEEDTAAPQVRTVIHTVFHTGKLMTYAEAYNALRQQTTPEAKFIETWKEKWKAGEVRDFTNGAYKNAENAANNSMANASPAAAAQASAAVAATVDTDNVFG